MQADHSMCVLSGHASPDLHSMTPRPYHGIAACRASATAFASRSASKAAPMPPPRCTLCPDRSATPSPSSASSSSSGGAELGPAPGSILTPGRRGASLSEVGQEAAVSHRELTKYARCRGVEQRRGPNCAHARYLSTRIS